MQPPKKCTFTPHAQSYMTFFLALPHKSVDSLPRRKLLRDGHFFNASLMIVWRKSWGMSYHRILVKVCCGRNGQRGYDQALLATACGIRLFLFLPDRDRRTSGHVYNIDKYGRRRVPNVRKSLSPVICFRCYDVSTLPDLLCRHIQVTASNEHWTHSSKAGFTMKVKLHDR